MNSDSPFSLQRAVQFLQQRNIELPQPFIEATELWRDLTNNRPAETTDTMLRDAIIARSDDLALGSALLQAVGSARLQAAWTQAITVTASRALEQLLEHRDGIHAQLHAQADELIAKLVQVAALADTPLNTLVREGRHDEARLLAEVDATAAELDALFTFTATYLTPGGFRSLSVGHISCARWRNGPDIDHALRGGITEGFLSGLRATPAGELWFPTAEEARAAAQRYWDDYAAAEQERQREQFGRGSVVAWG